MNTSFAFVSSQNSTDLVGSTIDHIEMFANLECALAAHANYVVMKYTTWEAASGEEPNPVKTIMADELAKQAPGSRVLINVSPSAVEYWVITEEKSVGYLMTSTVRVQTLARYHLCVPATAIVCADEYKSLMTKLYAKEMAVIGLTDELGTFQTAYIALEASCKKTGDNISVELNKYINLSKQLSLENVRILAQDGKIITEQAAQLNAANARITALEQEQTESVMRVATLSEDARIMAEQLNDSKIRLSNAFDSRDKLTERLFELEGKDMLARDKIANLTQLIGDIKASAERTEAELRDEIATLRAKRDKTLETPNTPNAQHPIQTPAMRLRTKHDDAFAACLNDIKYYQFKKPSFARNL